MFSYRDQLDTLAPIRLREGETKRIDCPFCGGRKTFTISRRGGKRVWNCYKASCGIRGGTGAEMSPETIQRRLERSENLEEKVRRSVPMPHVSDPKYHNNALDYLRTVGSMRAYEERWIKIRYAPSEDRVLFYTADEEGAVGRSLSGELPKWKLYGTVRGLLNVGTGPTAVVVEDAASACSVARVPGCTGCALLGTTLTDVHRNQLLRYASVIIALDEDASRKSVSMMRRLEGRTKVQIAFLRDDLKYLSTDEVERVLRP